MPEERVSGRRRRSIGFPMLTLLLLIGLLAAVLFVLIEYFPRLRLA